MINRNLLSTQILSYSDEVDDYGQKRQDTPAVRFVDMYVRIHSQTNTSDIRYVDIDVIGLTKDKDITDKNRVLIGDELYDVKYVIPSSRDYQILMKKV